jgi:hypothetical protein
MVKKNHVQKKATAEVLVFEQNMLKKKRSHRYGFVSEKKTCRKNKQPSPKHVCLVHWHKKMHQNKKRPHRYAFLSHQKRAKIKSEHAATGARSSLIF